MLQVSKTIASVLFERRCRGRIHITTGDAISWGKHSKFVNFDDLYIKSLLKLGDVLQNVLILRFMISKCEMTN